MHQLCTAPMMDWSDRHCRYFFRQLAPNALVYTEMITTGALLHGDVPHHLDFDQAEHPVALQLGGSEPADLASSAKLGESWSYDEINLNCGCPSERVQRGAFGACLMAEPQLVADCVKAIQDSVSLPVTVKHRLGIDSIEDYDFVRRFVEILAAAGCRTFIVHARNAILKGLSPKDNRQVPPLKYDYVYRLKADFPECTIVINGGIDSASKAQEALQRIDGVMLGRTAYHDPYVLAELDCAMFGNKPAISREEVVTRMWRYAKREIERGTPLRAITRHILGLYHGQPRARKWRQILSDSGHLARNDADLILQAHQLVVGSAQTTTAPATTRFNDNGKAA
ncbi:MAG TPA: tRNA dihydrouridine(20/20a) synthase DusA [Burkholderiales bacterium]|nr:tRNA dihydrouridine(20/20a) synthase DusA [Burkholderiales bacterium]